MEKKIIEYIKKNGYDIPRRQHRKLVDPRNYLIGILYFKYGWGEEDLGELVSRHHSTINSAKTLPYTLRNDDTFLENTKEVRSLFPYVFTKATLMKVNRRHRKLTISVPVDKEVLEILKKYQSKLNVSRPSTAIIHFIKTELPKRI
jgi:hypothetical protein